MHRGLPQARAFTAKAACCSACFLLTFLPAIASAGTYAGGSGTQAEPFRISTVSDWQELMAAPGDWASHFVLTDDLDLDGVLLSPVGRDYWAFAGVFDGNDRIIRDVDINMPGRDYMGLFGYVGTYGQIKNLGAEDISIFGRYYVGGLVGLNDGGTITNCYSAGSARGSDYGVGGLVGRNCGNIGNCYSTGSVSGTGDYVGGLVGDNDFGNISNSYSTGSVSGRGSVGGLVGFNYRGIVSSSFWDVNTSGWTTSAGGTGKTTSRMQDINTFLEAGWDFVRETANGTCNFWQMPQTGGYPVFSTFSGYIPVEPSGSGTEADPYIITDVNELGTVWYRASACYVMANDIDLAGINWTGPVVSVFNGVFDGNDYVIRNADVNMPGSDYASLFGYLGTNGQIKNLGIEDISVFGRQHVGGLVGYNCGTINNCYSAASVSGTGSYVGGLVGWNYGTISNSYAARSVSGGDWYVGGLVGYNDYGAVSDCYSTGSVSGRGGVGGLVGYNYEGAISSSFWDVNTSGWTTSGGGMPKTTAEMKTESTFTSAGWDFIEVWDIGENQTYPFLRMYLAGDINHDGVVDFRDIAHLAESWLRDVR